MVETRALSLRVRSSLAKNKSNKFGKPHCGQIQAQELFFKMQNIAGDI